MEENDDKEPEQGNLKKQKVEAAVVLCVIR